MEIQYAVVVDSRWVVKIVLSSYHNHYKAILLFMKKLLKFLRTLQSVALFCNTETSTVVGVSSEAAAVSSDVP